MTTPPMPSAEALLTQLTASLAATHASLPPALEFPKSGISLLDVKNDLLLSYLHNLSFLALLRLRGVPLSDPATPAVAELVKLRVLLERGVRPLEMKLKYQIDKVVAAATEAEEAQNPKATTGDEDSSGEDSEADDDDDDISVDGSVDAAVPMEAPKASASELAYRPNPASLALAAANEKKRAAKTDGDKEDGIYRPPRIAATSMPELPKTSSERRERDAPIRNRALDDFVADELSSAPIAQPSIGTTIAGQGRVVKTQQDRREEAERRDYEESNFVRLPKMSKKEQQQARRRTKGARDNAFGGEDWRSFAGDLDRLTKSANKGGRGERALDKSRNKRGHEGGEGREIGGHFEGRKNMLKRRKM
ncbi:Sas10/Utp3/C1D family-domain-containing protein [Geopyxis carbonaria]|nr:Sas10/Utp3/C1D family-domain-containing protein [Geopyxis carbonaria]